VRRGWYRPASGSCRASGEPASAQARPVTTPAAPWARRARAHARRCCRGARLRALPRPRPLLGAGASRGGPAAASLCPRPAPRAVADPACARAPARQVVEKAFAKLCGSYAAVNAPPPPSPPSRTKWTRLVHPSVLTGHVSGADRGRLGGPCAGGADWWTPGHHRPAREPGARRRPPPRPSSCCPACVRLVRGG